MPTDGPFEVEVKLTACDAGVLDEVGSLRELVGYELSAEATHQIRDCYWDAAGGRLSAHLLSLRLRIQDGAPRFTLKRAAVIDDGLFRRRETEIPATAAGWDQICSELAEEGAELSAAQITGSEPTSWLRAAGLEATQDRCTTRRTLIARRAQRPVAELALDTTTYRVGIYDVIFREIEIEALTDDAEHVVRLGTELRRRFADRLSPSEEGKYSRGLALMARLLGPSGGLR